MWVGAEVRVEVTRALRSARFLWASTVHLVSDAQPLVEILLHQAGRSWASDSQELRLMSRDLRDALRQTSHLRNVWSSVRRITLQILGVKGLTAENIIILINYLLKASHHITQLFLLLVGHKN